MADPPPPSQPAFTGPGRPGDCSPGALPHCKSSSIAGTRRLDPANSRGVATISQHGRHDGSWWPVQATSSPWHIFAGSRPCASSLSRDVLPTHGRFRTSPSRPVAPWNGFPRWVGRAPSLNESSRESGLECLTKKELADQMSQIPLCGDVWVGGVRKVRKRRCDHQRWASWSRGPCAASPWPHFSAAHREWRLWR